MSKTTKHIVFSGFYLLFGLISIFYVDNLLAVFLFWLFIALGNGLAGHRYFAHNQLKVHMILHWIFAFWCTISAYSSTIYWKVQHIHHHRNTDNEKDIHSPRNGFLKSFLFWVFDKNKIESVFEERSSKVILIKSLKDHAIKFTSKYFFQINFIFLFVLYFLDVRFIIYYGVGFLIENIRLGLINSILHIKNFPGNYVNHKINNDSQNNIFFGIITLGFGWHNNHHNDPSKLVLTEKWWEIDIEGQVGKLLAIKDNNEH